MDIKIVATLVAFFIFAVCWKTSCKKSRNKSRKNIFDDR